MEKLLLTDVALERKMALMLLHMIVHSVLVLLHGTADSADEIAIGVFLIRVCHPWLSIIGRGGRGSIFTGGPSLPALFTMTVVSSAAIRFPRKSLLCCTTCAVVLPCRRGLFARHRVDIK